MKEQLEKLEKLLRGDCNPKWEVTLVLLKEIVKAIDKSDTAEKEEKDTIESISEKIFSKADKLFKNAEDMISGYFNKK